MIGLIVARSKNNVIVFPEFDSNEFDIAIGETRGEDIKYTRTIYTRRNNFPKRDL